MWPGGAQGDVQMSEETSNLGSDSQLEGRYSNYVEVGFNAFEFIFDFGQLYTDSGQPRSHTKIVMSPHYAKNLLETLQKSLVEYETDYGAVMNTVAAGSSDKAMVSPALSARTPTAPAPAAIQPPVASAPAPASSPTLSDAVNALLDVLKIYLPAAGGGLPAPSVSIASVTERSLGLNNRRGEDARAGFGVVELKGGRLDAVARFELWAAQPADVEKAVQDLIVRLLADRTNLWSVGFLRISLEGVATSENVATIAAWRQTADVRVLYEFHFEGSDDSQGLIARIPININSTYNESTTVTDEMTRWDNQAARNLDIRGSVTVSALSMLLFVAGAAPGGKVTLSRTFDGASGPPVQFPTLAAFLAAISGSNPQRNAQLVFASWTNFMAIFQPNGTPVILGTNSYSPFQALLSPAISLAGAEDLFEIAYGRAALEVNAVAFLRGKLSI
jgi:hypothetical protein